MHDNYNNKKDTNMNTNEQTENTSEETTTPKPEQLAETASDIATIAQNLNIVKEHTKELETMITGLEQRLRVARGTRDLTRQVRTAQQTPMPRVRRTADPKGHVAQVLHGNSYNIPQIAKATGMTTNRIHDAIRELRAERKIANVGTEDFPRWTYRIGDTANSQELNAEVRRLISDRPMTTQELVDVTGCRLSRVSGALVGLQRASTDDSPEQLLNLGTPRRAKWFLVTDKAQPARLSPKGQ